MILRSSSFATRLAAVLAVGFVVTLVGIGPAAADTITFTGQGTNADGTCGEFEGGPPAPGGTQTWQFNLTQTMAGATMSASFSDGTSVSGLAESQHNGKTSMWFITTAAGAKVTSASASFTPDGPNSQFVVSHCTAGGAPPTSVPPTTPPPTTSSGGGGGGGTTTQVGGASTTAGTTGTTGTTGTAGAAQPVVSQPRTTG